MKCDTVLSEPVVAWSVKVLISGYGGALKCEKGIWWMPWRMEAMKDVTGCDKLWGGASNL